MNLSISEKIMNVNISFHFIFTRHSNISHGCHFVMTITILRYDADHSGALDRQEMYCLMVSIFYMVKADGVSTKVPNCKSTIKLKVPHFFKLLFLSCHFQVYFKLSANTITVFGLSDIYEDFVQNQI